MQKKLCSECGQTAEVSLCQILSTVGRTPRQQRCSTSTAYCMACLQGRVNVLRMLGLHCIEKPLSEALTMLADGCESTLNYPHHIASALASRGGR